MDQEFSMEKQNFTIVKEKIIKTNELLSLYNEKNETLNKVKNAFKQLKSKYEATVHEVDRLKLDNERLNFNLEALKSKSQQNDKELHELRADYKRTDERYQQTMIDSQQTISELEDKVKDCICTRQLLLSPTKGRSVNEKIKELKQKCSGLIKSESNLKDDCDSLQLKNKELIEEALKNSKVIKNLTAKNAELLSDMTSLKKVQKLESRDHLNFQQTLKSLKQSHEKEVHSLKMEISKLSLDNQRIRYLELECQNLKQQINNRKEVRVKKSHSCVQTEVSYFNKFKSKQDIGIQTAIIEPLQTFKVLEDDSLDLDYAVNDILSEMIVPMALSPMSFSSRIADSPIPPFLDVFEPLPPMEGEPFMQTPIPNIVITPPTPGTEVGNHSNVVFRLPTHNTEKEKLNDSRYAVVDPVVAVEPMIEIKRPKYSRDHDTIQSTNTILPAGEFKEIEQADVIEKTPLHKNLVEGIHHKIKPFKETIPTTGFVNSFATDTTEIASEDMTNTTFICEKRVSVPASLETAKTQEKVSSINNSKPLYIASEDGTISLKNRLPRRRKFWVPYDPNSFVKLGRKHSEILKAKVTKKHRDISSRPKEGDSILSALKTLQQNNINFTISNDSIPLGQPYNYYSLLSPPKTEPLTVGRRFTDTFSDSLSCWNKHCKVNNTQMLLRKVPNEEEPELLGFFSIKSEIITPSVSRMAVVEKPKPFDSRDTISELLNGIKELLEIKRKESLGNRRKKRTKSKNRQSDFYSETETELEKLFRSSADVLGRNRRFLAAAKEQSFQSNGESMFESESDAMVDSGLVTGSPKIDSDSMSLGSQYELGEKVSDNMFTPIIRNGENVVQDDVLQRRSESPLKDNEGFAGFSLSCKSSETIKNEALPLINNCTTPKFPTCPVMISPIASSKGSPETLRGSSTPFKIPEFSDNMQASPNCFKRPFCPDLISPMASSKGSPATPILRVIKDTNENSVDLFRVPRCPIMVSPLTLFSETNLESCSKKSTIVGCTRLPIKSLLTADKAISQVITKTEIANNEDVLKFSNIDHVASELLSDEDKEPAKDIDDRKDRNSEIKKSLVCQRITFDSVAKNENLDHSNKFFNNDIENLPKRVPKNVSFNSVTSASNTDINKDFSAILATSILLADKTEQSKDAAATDLKENTPTQTTENKSKLLEKGNDSTFNIDLSIQSTDINCTLEDINISQLELTSVSSAFSEPDEVSVDDSHSKAVKSDKQNQSTRSAQRRYSLRNISQSEVNDELEAIKTMFSESERRYSLRRISQSEAKNDDSPKLEPMETVSLEDERRYSLRTPQSKAKNDDSPKLEPMETVSLEDERRYSLRTPQSKAKNDDNPKLEPMETVSLEDERRYSLRTPQSKAKNDDSPKLEPMETVSLEDERRYSLRTPQSKAKNDDSPKLEPMGTVSLEAERRYPLRTPQSKAKNVNSLELEAIKIASSEAEDDLDCPFLRTRAAKRKFEDNLNNKDPENRIVTRLLKSAEDDEVTIPLKRKRGRPRKVNKIESLPNDSINDGKSQVDKSTKEGEKEKRSNVKNITTKKLLSSDSEDDDRKGNSSSKEDAGNISDMSENKIKRGKRLLRKRSSRSIKGNSSQDFLGWAKEERSAGSKDIEERESYVQQAEDLVRKEKNDISLAQVLSSEDLNDLKDKETRSNPTVRRYRKIISKEFISESESECDVLSGNVTETSSSGRVKERLSEDLKDSSSIVNNDMSANKINLDKSTVAITEDKVETIGETSMFKSGSCIQGNNSRNQVITCEIQNILRNISKEENRPKIVFVSSDINNHYNVKRPGKSNAFPLSAKDLFGDISDIGEESCNTIKDLKIKCKKIAGKKNLKTKILKQFKGTVYACTKNKSCDNLKKSCEDKPVEVRSDIRISLEEERLKSMPATEIEDKKINIVQDILISKGQAFNLLPNSDKGESTATVDISPSQSEKLPKPDSRKRIKLKQNISNTNTPVDILSQVMQGMIQNGPKLARKNASNLMPSRQSVQKKFNTLGSSTIKEEKIHQNDSKPWKVEENLAEINTTAESSDNVDEYLDCPKSPDVLEVPDRLPMWIPTEQPKRLPGSKVRVLIDKILVFSNEEKMLDDVIQEFAFQDVTYMTEIIVDKLSNDYHDKADCLFPPSPPMTSTQRTLLGFLLKLDKSTHPGIREKFLSLTEMRLFNRFTCALEIVQPLTRMYTALCKLRFDLNRIRRFICEGFYFIEELALPMLFTVLTMWPEVLPMESESSDHLLAKVLIQICYLKDCNQPGYNLMPLRDLLKKYYGYPTERWNCEDIFKEIMVEYIRNPSIRLSDFTLLLFLRNKPTKWVYQKIEEVIIPLYNQASENNPNLKATLVILLANICGRFRPYEEYDWSVILKMDKWFIDLERDNLDLIIKRAIHLARSRLPRRLQKKKKGAKKNTENNTSKNEDNLDSLETQDGTEELSIGKNQEETIEDSFRTNAIDMEATEWSIEESSQCTNNIVNIDNRLECNNETKNTCSVRNNNSVSYDSKSDSSSSDDDIEF